MLCVAWESSGYCWTGHADGALHLHAPGRWGAGLLPSPTGSPLCALAAVEGAGLVWVGDEGGGLRLVKRDPVTGAIFSVSGGAGGAPLLWGGGRVGMVRAVGWDALC